MTYSFPCQDLSLAGKQRGMAKGENTRSGLLWEVERLLNECEELPQVLLMENVTQVHGTSNVEHFAKWIEFLESKGYSNYWKDLNAKNFGIPQNRDRCFMVSLLGDYRYEFPREIPLQLRLKDMLEDSVDEKYYLSGKMVDYLHNITEKNIARGNGNTYSPSDVDGCSKCITTKEGSRVKDNFIEEPKIVQMPHGFNKGYVQKNCPTITSSKLQDNNFVAELQINVVGNYSPSGHDASRVVDTVGLAPTVKENHGTVTAIVEPIPFDYRYAEPFIVASRGRNLENPSDRTPGKPTRQRLEANFSGCSNTLTTVQKDNYVCEPLAYDEQNGYIRTDGTVGTLTTDGSSPKHNNRVIEPRVIGGIGKKKSNGGTQWYQQDRVYDNEIAISVTTGFLPYYKTEEKAVNVMSDYVSEKGVKYILDAKRGMATDVNADISQPLTAKGQANWTGSFVSPDIESIEKSSTIGSKEPTKINLKDGTQITSNDNLSGLRIRKLTPRECWRLMGFDDADFNKAALHNSNTQLYKQAGNSIVVDVLVHIFTQML